MTGQGQSRPIDTSLAVAAPPPRAGSGRTGGLRAKSALLQGLALARIRQTIAASACEQFASEVQQRHAASTVSTTGIDGTDEPGTLAAEVACRPGDRDALLYGLVLGFP